MRDSSAMEASVIMSINTKVSEEEQTSFFYSVSGKSEENNSFNDKLKGMEGQRRQE